MVLVRRMQLMLTNNRPGRSGVQVEAQQALHCPDVERWLHHPLSLP
jgi:hypothetical protein